MPGGFNVLGLSKRCKEEEERAGGAERPSRGPEAEREHGARGLGRPARPPPPHLPVGAEGGLSGSNFK